MMGAVLPVNLIAPRLAERIGAPATIAAGAALSALGCLALLGIEAGTSYWAICAQLIALSAGLGLLVPPLTSTLLGSVEKSRSGIAAGVLNATRQTGSVLGVALFGSLVAVAGAFMSGLHAVADHLGGRAGRCRGRDLVGRPSATAVTVGNNVAERKPHSVIFGFSDVFAIFDRQPESSRDIRLPTAICVPGYFKYTMGPLLGALGGPQCIKF